MLSLKNINKRLGRFALQGINLDIPEGEYFVLLGRSGSGKTQLLELIAGLSTPDSGEIWVNGRNVTHDRIQERNTGLLFQDYAVFPNMTVFGNIAYPLHSKRLSRDLIDRHVNAIAGEMNIKGILNRYPQNLSGGELQRVALARTLVNSPSLLLLDEPMASVDASLKDDIRRNLRQLNRKGLTIIHVTHDYREAISLAGRVGVIHNGHIIQTGTPEAVFSKPANKFVARYAGIRNFFRVRFRLTNEGWKAFCDGTIVFSLSCDNYPDEGLLILKSGDIILSVSRPQNCDENCFRGTVTEIMPCEFGMELTVDAGEIFYADLPANEFRKLDVAEGSEVWITFPGEAPVALPGTG